jgi:hypothetical protein
MTEPLALTVIATAELLSVPPSTVRAMVRATR